MKNFISIISKPFTIFVIASLALTYVLLYELILINYPAETIALYKTGKIISKICYSIVASSIFFSLSVYLPINLPKGRKKITILFNAFQKTELITFYVNDLKLKLGIPDDHYGKDLEDNLKLINPDQPLAEFETAHLYLYNIKNKLISILSSMTIYHDYLSKDFLQELILMEKHLLSPYTFDGYKKLAVSDLKYALITIDEILVHHKHILELKELEFKKYANEFKKDGENYRERFYEKKKEQLNPEIKPETKSASLKHFNYNLFILKSRLKSFFNAIFIHWPTIFFGLGIVILNILIFGSQTLGVRFPELTNQISILESLSRIIGVFLSVIFSLIILSFNIFNKYFGRFAFSELFKNKSLKFLFSAFVFTLTFLLYSLAYLNGASKLDSYGKSLFILSIIFSIIVVFSVFPIASRIIKDSQNRTNIKQLIEKLNIPFEGTEFSVSTNSNYQITASPQIMITEVGTISIKDYDYTTSNILIDDIVSNFKAEFELKDEIHLKSLYARSNEILKNLFPIAVKERNENVIRKIINARYYIEEFTIKNIDKIKLHDFDGKYQGWDFCFTIEDFFNRAIQFNEDEGCRLIIDRYRDFIGDLIESYFPGRFDYIQNDWSTYKNEDGLIKKVLADTSKLVLIAFNSKKYYLYQNFANLFGTLELNTLGSKNTEDGKVFLLHLINNWKYDSFETYLDSGNAQIVMLNYPFATLSSTQAIGDIECDTPFLFSIKALDLLFSKEKLNSMSINSLKAEAFYLINNLNANNINKKLLIIAFKEFEKLSSHIKESDNDYKKDIYIKLAKYLDYIGSQITEKEIKDREVLEAFGNTKKCFDNKPIFEKELKDKGYISNDKIV